MGKIHTIYRLDKMPVQHLLNVTVNRCPGPQIRILTKETNKHDTGQVCMPVKYQQIKDHKTTNG